MFKSHNNAQNSNLKNYLAISVPLCQDAHWFSQLRGALSHVTVRWQKGHYHSTIAFMNEMPEASMLEEYFTRQTAPTLTFDKLDAFSTSSEHILCITSSKPSEAFMSLVLTLRKQLIESKCLPPQDFLLHVTLARIPIRAIGLDDLKALIAPICIPTFTMTLTEVKHIIYKGDPIRSWELPQ